MIKQSTGEEWENASISLSTAQPDIGGSAPQLGIHYIGFQTPKAVAIQRASRTAMHSRNMFHLMSYEDDECEDMSSGEDEFMSFGQERYYALSSLSKPKLKKKRRSSVSSLEVTVAKV